MFRRPFAIIVLTAAPLVSVAGASFDDDMAFLRQHTPVIVLRDRQGVAQLAVAPAWQGRVMTSTTNPQSGMSFGWINRALIASGHREPHINAFGGEDRLWLGPEGGQFSIFFDKGATFDFDHWQVPPPIDTQPFKTVSHSRDRALFEAQFKLVNYAGTAFQVKIRREVRLLEAGAAWTMLGVPAPKGIELVAYQSDNRLTNVGEQSWRKETGLLSIWVLGMFKPSGATTIVVPIQEGPQSELGTQVTTDYFGPIPPERLHIRNGAIFFRGDGAFRSKIGINPRRSLGKLGSYDAAHHVLTLVEFSQPKGVSDYVNSLWKKQDDPYAGDSANSYNDGPSTPGARPLGPFYELESSSPAAALAPGASLNHIHRTFHLTGPESALDAVARAVLGVPLTEIETTFPNE